jgi:hypothetical protein
MRKHLSVYYSLFFALLGILGQLFIPLIVLADGTYANIGTADGADGSADAINFSQGRVWTIDQYGKYIWITQGRVNTTSHWAWSNNDGSTWTQGSESYTFLNRASVAYDSINDKLHVIWTATDSNDGIIYRRYGITRDGSNNITAISREDASNINLQLNTTSSRTLEQAVAYWVNDGSADGILIAVWSIRDGSLNETRASMRKLTITAADGVAGNWVALDGTGDSFPSDPPTVAADKIYTDTSGSNAASVIRRGGTGSHKDDLYVFVAEEDDAVDTVIGYRATWNSGSGNWSGGWTSLGTIGEMNTSFGYGLKYQLITKPVLDTTNDRLYVGWARWKDLTDRDTVSMAYLNSADTVSSTIDIYSALATHSYAPTLDIAYDATMDQIYAAYVLSTTNGDNGSIDYKTYDGTTLSSATRFYTSPGGAAGENGSADIPILYENRYDGKLLFGFRINGALPPTVSEPHTIDWGYITLPTPTPTPTATPTPTPTPAPSSTSTSSSSSGPSDPVAPVCSSQSPGSREPWIYAGESSTDAITLYFTEAESPFDQYYFSYGYSDGDWRFGTGTPAYSGMRTFTISSLTPNTTYYFRMRAGNGCATGPWSTTQFKLTTKKRVVLSSALFQTVPVQDTESSILKPLPIQTSPESDSTTAARATPSPAPVTVLATPIQTIQPEDMASKSSSSLMLLIAVIVGIVLLIALAGFAVLRMR